VTTTTAIVLSIPQLISLPWIQTRPGTHCRLPILAYCKLNDLLEHKQSDSNGSTLASVGNKYGTSPPICKKYMVPEQMNSRNEPSPILSLAQRVSERPHRSSHRSNLSKSSKRRVNQISQFRSAALPAQSTSSFCSASLALAFAISSSQFAILFLWISISSGPCSTQNSK